MACFAQIDFHWSLLFSCFLETGNLFKRLFETFGPKVFYMLGFVMQCHRNPSQ